MDSQFFKAVSRNLWIGSYPFEVPDFVDKLVICSKEDLPPRKGHEQKYFYACLEPRFLTMEDIQCALQAGRGVAGWIKRDKKVLVTCSTGKNRAAAVAAIALMTYGKTAYEAIAIVRRAVPEALDSGNFVKMLQRVEDAGNMCVGPISV